MFMSEGGGTQVFVAFQGILSVEDVLEDIGLAFLPTRPATAAGLRGRFVLVPGAEDGSYECEQLLNTVVELTRQAHHTSPGLAATSGVVDCVTSHFRHEGVAEVDRLVTSTS